MFRVLKSVICINFFHILILSLLLSEINTESIFDCKNNDKCKCQKSYKLKNFGTIFGHISEDILIYCENKIHINIEVNEDNLYRIKILKLDDVLLTKQDFENYSAVINLLELANLDIEKVENDLLKGIKI